MTTTPSLSFDAPPSDLAPPPPAAFDRRALVPRLRRLLHLAGGFTIDHRTGRAVHDGVAMAADPRHGIDFLIHRWDDRRVLTWLDGCHGLLQREDVYLGGWLDGARVWLDVVHVFPAHDGAGAVAHGRRAGERAGFDLGRRTLLPLTEAEGPLRGARRPDLRGGA